MTSIFNRGSEHDASRAHSMRVRCSCASDATGRRGDLGLAGGLMVGIGEEGLRFIDTSPLYLS
ncbi:MAG: hypothetical protein ABL994_24990 [Verrucomicrobiales bacterium]